MIKGENFPTQLWCSKKFQRLTRIRIDPVRNDIYFPPKPLGGLWTSTFTPNYTFCSGWLSWCSTNMPKWLPESENCCWVLIPSPNAKIYEVDNEDDYISLFKKGYRYYHEILNKWCIDWEKLSKDYDALHLTESGLVECATTNFELNYPELHSLYGWDCESTVWFRWKFDKAIPLSYVPHRCKVR